MKNGVIITLVNGKIIITSIFLVDYKFYRTSLFQTNMYLMGVIMMQMMILQYFSVLFTGFVLINDYFLCHLAIFFMYTR